MANQVNPTRMELTRLKKRLKTAVRGHKLLKDKRDEMVRRFIELVRKQRKLRLDCEQLLGFAMQRYSAANAEMGKAAVTEALYYPARAARLEVGQNNIMSIKVPSLRLASDKYDDSQKLPYSFAFTSSELDGAVLDLSSLLPSLIDLAESEKACDMLADEIEKTRRRVNALEYVMIPEMENQISYISMKLEENERGSQTRLMKVKSMLESRNA